MFVRTLSLVSAMNRRSAIEKAFAKVGVSSQFSDGIDGRVKEIERHVESGLTSPEAACALGHLQIYKEFLGSGGEWALVFEDDIEFTSDFAEVLEELRGIFLGGKLDRSVVLLLGGQEGIRSHFYFVGKVVRRFGRYRLLRSFRSDKYVFRACGYLINRRAAEGIIRANEGLIYRADEWDAFIREGAVQDLFLLRPGIVIHPKDLGDSAIQDSREGAHPELKLMDWLIKRVQVLGRVAGLIVNACLVRIQK